MDKKKSGKLYYFFLALAAVSFAAMLFLAIKYLARTNSVISELSEHAAAYATPSPVPVTLPPEVFETPAPPTPGIDPAPEAEEEEAQAEAESEEAPEIPDAIVYIDGSKTNAFYAGEDGVLYVRLSSFAELYGGEYSCEEDSGSFSFKGMSIAVDAGSFMIGLDGERTELKAPVVSKEGELYLPAEAICEILGFGILNDENNGISYYTYAAGKREIPEGIAVDILMYHSVGDSVFTGLPELHVKPDNFAAQVEYLIENGYSFITFEDLDCADSFEKPVILTFNNGYEDFYTEVFPILQQYGIKATVFVITDNIGTGHCLSEEQLREMSATGLVSVQSQTADGIRLNQLYAAQIRTNYAHSRLVITEITGIEPIVLCYPNGIVTNDAFLELSNYYRYGVAGQGAGYTTGNDARRIYRTYIDGGDSLESFIEKLER